MEQKFTKQERAKVMLQIKKDHGKKLSEIEEKYYSELPKVSPKDKKDISEELMHELLIFSHTIDFKQNPGQIIMSFFSPEGEDLTEEGYAKLASLIDEFEKGRK